MNVKAIVIGIMDRLSNYASREAQSETPEEKRKKELDAATKMLEQMTLKKDAPPPVEKESSPAGTPSDEATPTENGETTESSEAAETAKAEDDAAKPESTKETAPEEKTRGIPEDVRLYEIFYDQVVKLVNVGLISWASWLIFPGD